MPGGRLKRRRIETGQTPVDEETHKAAALSQGLIELPDAGPFSEETPDDTIVALHLLVTEFPAAAKAVAAPFALKSQLYSLVQDRTCVDRQLDDLRLKRQVRILKLPSSVDEYAYMFALDYRDMVGAVRAKYEVFDWLIDRVVPACAKTSIHHQELVRLLSLNNRQKTKDTVTESHVSLLLNAGLLVRDMQNMDVYLFSMAGAGPIVRSILKQRKDIVSALRRKRHPEVFVRELEKRRQPAGALVDYRFVVRDMIGTNTLSQQQTTSGPLLRLTPRH